MLGAIAIVLVLITFAATDESKSSNHGEETRPSLPDLLKMLSVNVPFLQIMAGIGCFSFANILINSGLIYYVKYNLGADESIAGGAASIMQMAQAASIIPWTIASRYIGKRRAWLLGLAVASIGPIGLYVLHEPGLNTVYVLLAIYSAGAGATAVNFWSIVPDTVEYGELRSWRCAARRSFSALSRWYRKWRLVFRRHSSGSIWAGSVMSPIRTNRLPRSKAFACSFRSSPASVSLRRSW